MKKLLFSAVTTAALALAGVANATDLRAPVYKAPPVLAPIPANWSGFYVGGNIGGGIAVGDFPDQDCFTCADVTLHRGFGEIGAQAGYNWQWGSTVLGVEGDINWTSANVSVPYELCCSEGRDTIRFKFDAFVSIRARAGLVVGPALVYVTAGPAWGHFDSRTTVLAGFGFGTTNTLTDDGWHSGMAIGAGLEYMLSRNWTIRGEFLYLDFSDKTVSGSHDPTIFHIHHAYGAEVARLGFNYKFGGGEPILVSAANLGAPGQKGLVYKAPVLSPTLVSNWSGLYVGVNFGGGMGNANFLDPDCFTCANVTLHKGFGEFGGQVGHNWQWGWTVLGLEGDLNATSFNESSQFALSDPGIGLGTVTTKFDAFGSIRARAGLAVGPTLIYVTAGPAWGHFKSNMSLSRSGDTAPDDSWRSGIAAGAGLEVMVAPSWTIRGEYLVLDFTDRLVNLIPTSSDRSGDARFRMNYAYGAQLARLGLNYKFDAGTLGAPGLGSGGWAAPIAPAQNWSGLYAGVNAGGGMADSKNLDPDCPSICSDITFHSPFGEIGGQIGHNWQWGRTILGLEGDLNWASVEKSAVINLALKRFGTAQFKFDAFASIRGRAGLTVDRTLFYVTAGPAWGHFNSLTTIYNGGFSSPIQDLIPDDSWHVGIAAGAGLEFMVAPNWSIRGEYLHLDFVDAFIHWQQVCCGSGNSKFRRNYGYSADVARVGLNYKFDWGPVVVAKY